MAAGSLHISISAETLFTIAGFPVTNSMLTSLVASGILLAFALAVHSSYKDTDRPTGLQNFAEWLVEGLYGMVHSVTENRKKTELFLPFIASFFLFIVINNWVGLLPGVGTIGIVHEKDSYAELLDSSVSTVQAAEPNVVIEDQSDATFSLDNPVDEHANEEKKTTIIPIFRAGTADLNMTLALALFSQVVAQIVGFQYVGMGYLKKFFNFSSPIMFFVGILEFLGEFTKVISFAFRLFGNIFAGEVLLVVISFLVPLIVPMPFYGLELFVGMIQGLVFAMLSLVFFNMATISHDEEHH